VSPRGLRLLTSATMARSVMHGLGLTVLVSWSTLRIILYGVLDKRPLLGFEAADLQRSMFYHYGLRGHLDYTFVEQIARDGFKPPLWYGGIPMLFSWRDTLSSLDYLFVNAAALLVAVWAVWSLGKRLGGSAVAFWSVLCFCALPGLAGSSTLIGVEMTQVALVACLALSLVALRGPDASARTALGMGLLLGFGMLAKWNLLIYLLLPILWILVALRPRSLDQARPFYRLLAALLLASLIFLMWLVPCADVQAILAGSQGEASHVSRWSAASLLFYPRALLQSSLGAAAAPAVLLSLWGWWRVRGEQSELGEARATRAVLVAIVLSALLVLTWLPHKEIRYLQPMYPALAVLLAYGLAACSRRMGSPGRIAAGLAAAGMVALTLVVPWLQTPSSGEVGDYQYSDLRPAPTSSDYGIEEVVRHPSLREPGIAIVTYSIGGDSALPTTATLQWELYGRNRSPVISRYNHAEATLQSCRYDLVRSSHFLTNHVLSAAEVDTLIGLGYELRISSRPRIGSMGLLQLWQRVGRWN